MLIPETHRKKVGMFPAGTRVWYDLVTRRDNTPWEGPKRHASRRETLRSHNIPSNTCGVAQEYVVLETYSTSDFKDVA